MSRQLLIDTMVFSPEKRTIKESTDDNKSFLVEGVVQRAEQPNKNGRIYPKKVLEPVIEKYIQEFVNENRAYGELDHPDRDNVELKAVSHTIENLYWKGDDLYAVIDILDTPNGNIVRNLIRAGKTVGISSRALGSIAESRNGNDIVDNDLELVCWDFVSDPSTHNAYTYLKENHETKNESKLDETTKYLDFLIDNIICSNGNCKLIK